MKLASQHEAERWLAEEARRGAPRPERLREVYRSVEERIREGTEGQPRRSLLDVQRRVFAIAAVAVGAVLATWLVSHRADDPLDVPLEAAHITTNAVLPKLELSYQGSGHMQGTERHPKIDWTLGRIELSLDPGAGVELTVLTSEASVQVTGTRFAVERDARGTLVALEYGGVRVQCIGAAGDTSAFVLGSGEQHWCLPTSPSGLLGRARTLQQRGDPLEAERAVDLGLASAKTVSPARGELLAMAMELRLEQGDESAAREAASMYLDEGYPARNADVQLIHDRLTGQAESTKSTP